jgi:mannosylfructose-phosphate synthase
LAGASGAGLASASRVVAINHSGHSAEAAGTRSKGATMISSHSDRILMISTHGYVAAEPEFGKPDTGGQVVYVLELSKSLARMGYEVDILTRRFVDQPFSERIDDRITLYRFPCGGNAFIPKETLCDAIPEWVEGVSRWMHLNRVRYKLINSHYWDAGLAGQAISNRFAIPHVHTPHSIGSWKRDNMGLDPEDMEKKYNFRRRIREEKVIYDECDLLIATTPTQRDVLCGVNYDVPEDKISVIPPGYDDHRFFPVSLATRQSLKLKLGFDGPVVLALGRIAKNKGYDLLLRAMPTVLTRVPDARLVLAIGSTAPNAIEQELLESFRQLADELAIADSVVFKDYITDEELADHYRAADVFALSSRYEPFGMTAIEAMACGTPAIVTTEGGLCEQLAWGIEALYANPFDPEAFGQGICFILQYPGVAGQLSKFGPRKARSHFTWTGIAQQLLIALESRQDDPLHVAVPLSDLDDRVAEEASWSH